MLIYRLFSFNRMISVHGVLKLNINMAQTMLPKQYATPTEKLGQKASGLQAVMKIAGLHPDGIYIIEGFYLPSSDGSIFNKTANCPIRLIIRNTIAVIGRNFMKQLIKPVVLALSLFGFGGQASAHVPPGGVTVTYDSGTILNAAGNVVKTGAALPGSLFSSANSYVENTVQTGAIGFGTVPGDPLNAAGGFSHIHGVANPLGSTNTTAEYLRDSGGGFFRQFDGAAFSIAGMDVANLNLSLTSLPATTITLRGYTSADFSTFTDAILTSNAGTDINGVTTNVTALNDGSHPIFDSEVGNTTNGFLGTHIHLDGVADFQNIYLFEYFYTGQRGIDNSFTTNRSSLVFGIDNVVFAPAAVPLPAAVYLFGTGIIGLFGAGRKRRNAPVIAA